MRQVRPRKLYKVTLCYYGENFSFFRHASTRDQAANFAIRGLEKKKGYMAGTLLSYFSGDKDNKRIEEVKDN